MNINHDAYPELAHPDGPAAGAEPCRACGQPIPKVVHPIHKTRHVCGPPCNDLLKRRHKRAEQRREHEQARTDDRVEIGRTSINGHATYPYEPHAQWITAGGRGYAERLWGAVVGNYVLSLSTGMIKVGRSGSVGRRLAAHFKNCQNYGVEVVAVAVVRSSNPLQVENALRRYIQRHPTADWWPQLTESAMGVPFSDVVKFIEDERLGDLWKPVLPPGEQSTLPISL